MLRSFLLPIDLFTRWSASEHRHSPDKRFSLPLAPNLWLYGFLMCQLVVFAKQVLFYFVIQWIMLLPTVERCQLYIRILLDVIFLVGLFNYWQWSTPIEFFFNLSSIGYLFQNCEQLVNNCNILNIWNVSEHIWNKLKFFETM